MIKQGLRWIVYPATLIAAFLVFAALKPIQPLAVATYAAVFFGIGIIVLLERWMPYRRAWHPPLKEFIGDALYAVLIQVLLPQLLAFTALLLLASHIEYVSSFWPHEWPLPLQALLMMMSADFLRYWLHRLMHTWSPLWRLHEVHHSVERLYWLNTSRFHPFDKALQFILDALPFILLGVSEQVIAIYFVFYAINGFYQHSNADVRLGFLNFLISGPELHRWHHSKTINESNSNYGNNLIIWDLIFGTRFLPRDREVETLGILQSSYPSDLVGQLFVPFRRRN